ncbi:MAG: hypothetical protein QG579_565, partial [Patescibacteria group bacterium]|nr:hypothetical protein [Patescibacteria group bacterium]
RGDSSSGMSLDGSNQSAQVVNFSTKITEGAVYKRGDKSDVILQVQEALTKQGLYKGDISGTFGPITERAVKDFQTKNGLTATGILDTITVSAILKSDNGRLLSYRVPVKDRECLPDTYPWIQIVYPVGGEIFEGGQTIQVRWKYCNVDPNARAGLHLLFPQTATAVSGIPLNIGFPTKISDTEEHVTFWSDVLSFHDNYKIIIFPEGETGIGAVDYSNTFSIIPTVDTTYTVE